LLSLKIEKKIAFGSLWFWSKGRELGGTGGPGDLQLRDGPPRASLQYEKISFEDCQRCSYTSVSQVYTLRFLNEKQQFVLHLYPL
jgi:hypothetical protein